MEPVNTHQPNYSTLFDRDRLSTNIKEKSFPTIKRAPAQKVEGNPWLQKGSLSPVIEHGELNEIWNRRTSLASEEVAKFKTSKGIVELNREGIELALDRRVALFFQQSILCYKMPFIFSAQGADDQIGIAKSIHLSSHEQKEKIVHKREAAHSSTIPTLLARAKDDPEERVFVYLKGGSSHAQHNATIGMHIDVNGADELLDGKGNKGLRNSAVKILNQVAEGLDPIEATKKFLKKFEKKAKQASEKLEIQDTRKAVLETYIQGIQTIAQHAESDQTLFDQLIGVKINPDDPEETILRKTIYKSRYDIICLAETIESRIGKCINDTKKEMSARDGSFLEYILLKEFTETNQCKILEKLLAKTAVIFEEQYKENLSLKQKSAFQGFQTRIKNLQEKYPQLLNNLKRDLRSHFRELSSSEFAYRSKVFNDLRTKVRKWTQKEFCQKYYEITGKKVSQSWVSRMEGLSRINTQIAYQTPFNQRTRAVTLEDAKNCAKTFNIDVGLFLPSLITSNS